MKLLVSRRFLPLFITQFLGALNDNLLKNAMVMLITYHLAAEAGQNAQLLVTMAAGIFILPFFLFSALAGQLADKYDRAKIAQIVKLAEILLMVLAAAGFYLGNITFLLIVLFGMGVHSAFFGPIKYALLPQHLQEAELLAGNAYVEAGTFLAILLGTILGGLLIMQQSGIAAVSLVVLAVALAGYCASRFIPPAPAPMPQMPINRNPFTAIGQVLKYSYINTRVFRSILGISWFWLVGATFLSQFPTYAKDIIYADETVVTLFLTLFSIGIGIGSLLSNKLLKGQIQSTYVPLAALGISLFGMDLYYASLHTASAAEGKLLTVQQFVGEAGSLRILLDLTLIAICGGIYIVPLYAIMQHFSDITQRARIIAANNIMNALFMVAAAMVTLLMLKSSFTIPEVFLTVAIGNAMVALYICSLLPDAFLRSVFRVIFWLCYRVEVKGLEYYHQAGKRVLIIANHTSFLDAALIAAYLPEKITFAVNTHVAKKWWMRPLLLLVKALPLDPTNPLAAKSLIDRLKQGHPCMIFPEGRITVTGALMKIYEGPGMIADKAEATLLPIRIEGAQYTPFSRLHGKVKRKLFPNITLTILPPCEFNINPDIKGRRRRQQAAGQLYEIMAEMIFDSSPRKQTLFAALLEASKIHGGNHIIAEDIERKPISYHQFIMRIFIVALLLRRNCRSARDKIIGVMLPNAISTVLVFFGMHILGRIPALLNFSTGAGQIKKTCQAAGIHKVITSRRFIALARLEPVVQELQAADITFFYLEDIKRQAGFFVKVKGLLCALMPFLCYRLLVEEKLNSQSPAVVLFTSGSEGTPKGVVLSHQNINANRFQLASRVDFGPQDIVFNCLPMFHSFGLTGGTLLPLLAGIKTFYYPSPLHYRIVPELVYDTNATIMFGTDTFLAGYARFAHVYDFHSVRYIFSGAEKLKESTRQVYADKYGIRIFEGYGATETSPVISTNTPMHNRKGTVGKIMPAIMHRLEPVSGVEEGGRLWVKGPNVMLGYFRVENPGMLQPLEEGWYDTGDIVVIDEDGFVTIKGRSKRFAKIGGEMISLIMVEEAFNSLWPEHVHAVITAPDKKKGEQLVAYTTYEQASWDALKDYYKKNSISELALPRKVIVKEAIPLLATGKIDYQTLHQQNKSE